MNSSSKKTEREKIAKIISERNLVSYMNNTKWSEFIKAMREELPFEPPYDYKTLFDDSEYSSYLLKGEGPFSIDYYDDENFNFSTYKTIEWVKVRPHFFELTGGYLVKEKVWHDCEKEFVEALRKYSIPYEEDNGLYTIYGYR
ncbi:MULTISPECIES: DUF6678 family protein [unclassified Adlercreutzia]|uniref:DUF6678 family protein n=1 Tax=unclassified Adlercreutzia TaxID=2636013 RepID=UPI0013EC4DEB|nr:MULTISPECIES: DUF6678 family protein [unclassified Adlercreutzia]